MALKNGLELGEQARGRPSSRLQAKEAMGRTLKSVGRSLAHFGSHACAGTERTHGTLESIREFSIGGEVALYLKSNVNYVLRDD